MQLLAIENSITDESIALNTQHDFCQRVFNILGCTNPLEQSWCPTRKQTHQRSPHREIAQPPQRLIRVQPDVDSASSHNGKIVVSLRKSNDQKQSDTQRTTKKESVTLIKKFVSCNFYYLLKPQTTVAIVLKCKGIIL